MRATASINQTNLNKWCQTSAPVSLPINEPSRRRLRGLAGVSSAHFKSLSLDTFGSFRCVFPSYPLLFCFMFYTHAFLFFLFFKFFYTNRVCNEPEVASEPFRISLQPAAHQSSSRAPQATHVVQRTMLLSGAPHQNQPHPPSFNRPIHPPTSEPFVQQRANDRLIGEHQESIFIYTSPILTARPGDQKAILFLRF